MINDKSVSAIDNSILGGKTSAIGATSRPKFENVQKLSSMVKQIEHTSHRSANPQQILQAIKNNIKSNYNRLYDNYEANRTVIQKNIQQTETNNANEGSMKQRFENVLKEKNAYDKLKVQVQQKQKKLKKLMEIRDQILTTSVPKDDLKDTLIDRATMIREFEEYREVLDYEAAVLDDMKKQRQHIKLALKQRHDNMVAEQCIKKERTKKIQDTLHTKKVIVEHIDEKIKKEEICQIPESLSEELQRKLAEYSGKHSQEQILRHEKLISEERLRLDKEQYERQQNMLMHMKQAKENEEKKQYEIAYNHYLLKQAEELQIKNFCRVDSIGQIANGIVEQDRVKLQLIAKDIQQKIQNLTTETQKLRSDIQTIMTSITESRKLDNINILDLQKQLQKEETQLRRLKAHAAKKQNITVEWESVLQTMLGGKCERENIIDRLRACLEKYEGYSIKEHCEGAATVPDTVEVKNFRDDPKFKRIAIRNQSSQDSEEQLF